MPRYRQGSKVPLNVYDGNRPLFQAHSVEEAERIVALLNVGERVETTGTKEIAQAVWDPGAILPRGDNFEEPLAAWQTRAVMHVLLAHETPPGSPVPEIEPVGAQDTAESREGHTGLVVDWFPAESSAGDVGRCPMTHDQHQCRFAAGHTGGCHGGEGLTTWATLMGPPT